jgi:hypothetical protein
MKEFNYMFVFQETGIVYAEGDEPALGSNDMAQINEWWDKMKPDCSYMAVFDIRGDKSKKIRSLEKTTIGTLTEA